jgi:hypothetical protein
MELSQGEWEWGIENGDLLPYGAWIAYLDNF